jgi:hypothetical protein
MARKEKQYHFIYKTTNLLNGKYYYGMHSTNNLNDGYYGSGKRLRYSLNKYGKKNHKVEILEYLSNRKLLINREKEIVNLNEIAKIDCINLMVGGSGGLSGLSINSIKKIREGASKFLKEKWKNIEFAKKINKLSSDRMKIHHKNNKIKYDNFKGKKHTIATILKMKKSHKAISIGKNNSQYNTCWIMKDNINKKIKKCELETYIQNNWIRGRKMN